MYEIYGKGNEKWYLDVHTKQCKRILKDNALGERIIHWELLDRSKTIVSNNVENVQMFYNCGNTEHKLNDFREKELQWV